MLFIGLIGLLPSDLVNAQSEKDGKLFDQGVTMLARSPRAADALDAMRHYAGQWDVAMTVYPTDTTQFTTSARAHVTYMNRGYAYLERLETQDIDGAGTASYAMSFLSFNPARQLWALGEADAYTEAMTVYTGAMNQQDLVLQTGIRHGGGLGFTTHRVIYRFEHETQLAVLHEISRDGGVTWLPTVRRVYTRRAPSDSFMPDREGFGAPAKDSPPEARQFDFLLGEWDAHHELFYGGRWVSYSAATTAVHALGGHAILEYSWYDVDVNLPDAATTILRMYNRAARRWESLYLDNRNNALLHFGGSREEDAMVLHLFDVNRNSPAIPRVVFRDIEPDRYSWFAENSTDRGITYANTWSIEVERIKSSPKP